MENDKWLPDGAKEPKSKTNYTMPLDEGQHRLRVLSSAIVGYEGWKKEGDKSTPVRYKTGSQPDFGPDGKDTKYFWAFLVWNYEQERVQIMAVTQKTIRTQIEALISQDAWGNPKLYDIVITRKGMKMEDTEYTVMPNPHTDAPDVDTPDSDYLKTWQKGDDPFKKE